MVQENGVYYVGVNDDRLDLFEGMYSVPEGMLYNSYVILDDKIAVMNTVDSAFEKEWLEKVAGVMGERLPDYLIIQHMEPDHSASILAFTKQYPQVKIVSSEKSFVMMKNYFQDDFLGQQVVVADGDTLSLGSCELLFLSAPMVHWPEVLFVYEKTGRILFSADAFGRFGGSSATSDWACEARRYYFGIVGKFGAQVQSVLKKLAHLEICAIYPLHGPILKENVGRCMKLYDTWSSYRAESDGVAIFYTSVYGNTKAAVDCLQEKLQERDCCVCVYDLARCDMSEAIEDAFRYNKLVLATTTYNGGLFPFMRNFLHGLTERNFQNRTVALIENGSWAPMAIRMMKESLSKCKDLRYIEPEITILSAVTRQVKEKIALLADNLSKN